MKLLVVDSNSIVNRAFYAIKLLSTKNGMATNAIVGFLNILYKLIEETNPDCVVCAFDLKAPTFRHKQYAQYKAGRKSMPQELAMQIPVLKELLEILGFSIVSMEGFEADDILGTFAKTCEKTGDLCVIATGDRDSLQLVSDKTSVLLASSSMGKAITTVYDVAAVVEKYLVMPQQLMDIKALMGDSSDNIPGVAGIGEKTAISLISSFESIENIYQNIDTLDIKQTVKTKLINDKENAYLSYELGTICTTVPISLDFENYRIKPIDYKNAYRLFSELELNSFINKLQIKNHIKEEDITSDIPNAHKSYHLCYNDMKFEQHVLAHIDEIHLNCNFNEEQNITDFVVLQEDKIFLFDCNYSAFDTLLKTILSSSKNKITNDAKSLYHFGYHKQIKIINLVFCLKLAGYLIYPTSSNAYEIENLENICGILPVQVQGEVPEAKQDFVKHSTVFDTLYLLLSEKIKEYKQEYLLHEIELPLANVLSAMEYEGFALDVEGMRFYGEELLTDILELEKQIYIQADGEFNINSPKQLGVVLFEKLNLPTGKKTKSGYSTNAEVLNFLKDKHAIIPLILEYRQLAKLKSTYVDGFLKLVDNQGRIHSIFQQTETRTGRISSIEPNLQNIPVKTQRGSKLRAFFIAKEGYQLVDADYSQIELRVLAHIAKDKNMIEAFNNNQDIHTITASQVFDMPPLFVTPQMRNRAKAVNFGIVYGMGAFSLSENIGVSVADAKKYISNYFENFSGVKKYMETIVLDATENGYVTTEFNRRRYIPELSASNKIVKAQGNRIAMNTPIQGTAADIIKIAMIRVYTRLKAEQLGAKLILQIHDELIIESPVHEAERVKVLLEEEMKQAIDLTVAMEVEAKIGANWLETK